VAKRKRNSARLSVFKGREVKLNHAIFHILAIRGPLTLSDIHKEVRTRRRLRPTRYASVNKRVRSLEKSGYIKKIGAKKTKTGFKSVIYQLSAKAYLAILLNSMNLDDLLMRVDEASALVILATISCTTNLYQ
jgi:DNA-binding Lrp family transcriptional regulator